jgi:hypothetical protein
VATTLAVWNVLPARTTESGRKPATAALVSIRRLVDAPNLLDRLDLTRAGR